MSFLSNPTLDHFDAPTFDLKPHLNPTKYEVRKFEPDTDSNEETSNLKINLDSDTTTVKYEYNNDAVHFHINKLIRSLKFPSNWKGKINPPNVSVKKSVSNNLISIFDNYKLLPDYLSCSAEGGIYCLYKDEDLELDVEFYNNLEIATVLSQSKEIIYSSDIFNENFQEIFSIFKEKQTT